MSQILDGKIISESIARDLSRKIGHMKTKPKLLIIQVGENKESDTYIKHKKLFADKIDVTVEYKKYKESVREEFVIKGIKKYNEDQGVHGIIVQLPLPEHLSTMNILEAIDREKDVDGLTSGNVNSLLRNERGFVSGATKAVLTLLDKEGVDLAGKKIVVVGNSALVGKPTALALINRNATVTVCNEFTKNLAKETKQADILITAVGKPMLITADYVVLGQIIIDIGITVIAGSKVTGDVDYKNVKDKVRAITPVPGGIGPITIACLFENLVEAYLLMQTKDLERSSRQGT